MATTEIELRALRDTTVADWRDEAVCKGKTQLFFPPMAERPQARVRRQRAAKALCDACPVVDECRQFARTNREYGYWAGESEEDRYVLGYRVSAPIGIRCSMARNTAPQTSTN